MIIRSTEAVPKDKESRAEKMVAALKAIDAIEVSERVASQNLIVKTITINVRTPQIMPKIIASKPIFINSFLKRCTSQL
jgi:hypothetical protein